MSPAEAFLLVFFVIGVLTSIVAILVAVDFVHQKLRKRAERKRRSRIDEWEWEKW